MISDSFLIRQSYPTMNHGLTNNPIVEKPTRVVEIIGPAGAGKTTLVEALNKGDERIVAGVRLHKIRYVPFFVRDTLLLLPTFLRHYRHSRWFSREEIRAMVYLPAWHGVLRRQAPHSNTVTVLDHGPIFRLALLREFGPEITRSQVYERWWDGLCQQWAATLDMVIWLDAPDAVLIERIEARPRWHAVKGRPDSEAREFLARYRKSYEQVVAAMTARNGPRVIRFDTHRETVNQMADRVLAALEADQATLDVTVPDLATEGIG